MPQIQDARTLGIGLPQPGQVDVYVDGACSGNPGPGGWAAVLVNVEGEARITSGGDRNATNNQMELLAAIDAVTRGVALAPRRLVVHADSKYVIDGITTWIKGWRRNNWRTSTGAAVKNQALWQRLDGAMQSAGAAGVPVAFEWVRGHAGHPGNEAADAAARQAIRQLGGTRTGGAVAAALALLLAASLPAHAEPPQDALPGRDAASAVREGGWIVSGGDAGDWGFAMGPVGAPTMHMKLLRANADRSGAVGFMCSRQDGAMQLALTLPGAAFELNKERDLSLSVGDRTQPLRVVVRTAPPAGEPPTFETTGPAIPDILKAMSEVPAARLDARLRFDDEHSHAVSFGLTQPRGVAGAAAEICAGWAMAAHPTGTVAPPAAPAGTAHAAEAGSGLSLPPMAAEGSEAAAGAAVSPPDGMPPGGAVNTLRR